MPANDLKIRSIDFMTAAKSPPRRRKLLLAAGGVIGRRAHGEEDDDTLVGSELAPQGKLGPVASFHIDEVQGASGPWLLAHIFLRPAPKRLTPEMLRNRKAGYTTKWLFSTIAGWTQSGPAAIGVDVHGVIPAGSIASDLPSALFVGGRMLEPVGVEYRRRKNEPTDEGPQGVRLRGDDEGLEFWLEYRIREPWSAELWDRETQRSAEFLKDLAILLA